jgi:hypothetical protein
MAAIIVIGSIVFGAAMTLAWLLRPDMRSWMEEPKLRFQNDARRYDRAVGGGRE